MIQRIQSVYLFLAALLSVLLFFLPLAGATVGDLDRTPEMAADPLVSDNVAYYVMDVFNIKKTQGGVVHVVEDTYWLAGLNAIILLLTLVIIFLYKNRLLQAQLVRFCFLLVLIFIVLAFYYAREMQNLTVIGANIEYKIADLIPLIQLLFLHLATRGINKDEALVRSADRIR